MPLNDPLKLAAADDCAREPIHIPGGIQPHGVLLAARPIDLIVTQCAGDTEALLGIGCDRLLGGKLLEILPPDAAAAVERCLREQDIERKPVHLSEHRIGTEGQLFDVFVHRIDGQLVLEMEHLQASPHGSDIFARLLQTTGELHAAESLENLLDRVPVAVREMTGFDRVMVYRFLDDDSGTVVSEARSSDLVPYLGLRFPAFDIPPQARELYKANWIRLIPDAAYTPRPIQGQTSEPLNMSFCALRSVSPIHLQYLANMDVRASMSISIVKDGQLWGLIACHHRDPRHVPHAIRAVCALLGQLIALEVGKRVAADREKQRCLNAQRHRALVDAMEGQRDLARGLLASASDLLGLVQADGVAVCTEGKIRTAGRTPRPAQIRKLLEWLNRRDDGPIFATAKISSHFASARRWEQSAGVLAMEIARGSGDCLVWFRDEILKTVRWAGDPRKAAVDLLDPATPLSPRNSFRAYEEQVRGTAKAWDQEDLATVDNLRVAIVERSLRTALAHNEELAQHREMLIHEVNHRVKNSLQLTSSIISLQSRRVDDPKARELFAETAQRIRVAARTHEKLYRGNDSTNVEFGEYLRELCADLERSFGRAKVEVEARKMQMPADRAISLALIANELITNAFKYAFPGETAGRIEVRFSRDPRQWRLHIADNGVGLPENFDSRRSGSLGMRIVDALTRQLGATLEARPGGPGAVFVISGAVAS